MTPHEEMKAHEKLCAERYSTIHKRLDRIESARSLRSLSSK